MHIYCIKESIEKAWGTVILFYFLSTLGKANKDPKLLFVFTHFLFTKNVNVYVDISVYLEQEFPQGGTVGQLVALTAL